MPGAKTEYGLYLNYRGTTDRFPINPETFTINRGSDDVRYNILDIGEVIIPRIPKLRDITWECWFPGNPNDPYVLTSGRFRNPQYYIDKINKYKEDRTVLRFVANRYEVDGGAIFDTNIQVVVEDFNVEERGGEVGDMYYTITLTEYRDIEPETVNITLVADKVATAAVTPQRAPASGEIAVGDTVIANGTYYYTSYGDSPTGKANNLRTVVTRIVSSSQSAQKYTYHIGSYGWLLKSQLTKV